jgi:hypothetical protein
MTDDFSLDPDEALDKAFIRSNSSAPAGCRSTRDALTAVR